MTEVTFCTKRLYDNPEAGIHVPCWNYLYQCSSITGGGIVPPHFSPGNFMIYQEKSDKEGNGEEKKEHLKGKKWKIENGRGKVWKRAEDFFLFIFLIIYLFIYFACHFLKPLKFVFGVYQNGQFYQENSYFMLGKNQETWLCPLWKIFLLHHCTDGNTDYGSPLVF